MADGSVVIDITLDTAAFEASVRSLEAQVASLGERMSQSIVSSLTTNGIGASFSSSLVGISGTIKTLAANITETMRKSANDSMNAFVSMDWAMCGSTAALGIENGLRAGTAGILSAINEIKNSLASAFGGWESVGAGMMSGIASGIRMAGVEVIDAMRSVSVQTTAAAKQYFDIHSPSRLMRDEVGVMISRGIAEGILDGRGFVSAAMTSVSGSIRPDTAGGSGGRSITQNIYLRDSDNSPYRTAKRIKQESEAAFRYERY